MNEEDRIKDLEKQVEKLSFVRGISDKYGSYKSLQKDAEIIMFFLANTGHKRRYIELINEFQYKGWAKSTIEKHLSNLTKKGVLNRTSLPGEYEVADNLSNDMDLLVQHLVGDSIYKLARKSWEKKINYY